MNILFLSLLDFDNINEHNIYTDLLREFCRNGHNLCAVSPVERKNKRATQLIVSDRIKILKLQIGNIQKTNMIEKGISTLTIENKVIKGIKKYFADEKFDLVLYTTPPITLQKAVNFVKKRDGAIAYLMLKDIFPQNAVDIGILSKRGLKGILYKYFRNKEKRLYRDSDYIGCMSPANVKYILEHNPEINSDQVEVCPNCIEPQGKVINASEKSKIRKKLGIQDHQVLFVYGGNLGKPQGVLFIIECLKSIKNQKDVQFLIVGNGTEYARLEEFVKVEKPENVKIMSALPKEEYENLILAADVGMLFLDYRFTIPNFPSRVLSYMDAGLPVLSVTDVVSDVGEMVEAGKFGRSVRSNHVQAFIDAVEYFKITGERERMGNNARKYLVDNYTVQINYDTIIKHLENNNLESI